MVRYALVKECSAIAALAFAALAGFAGRAEALTPAELFEQRSPSVLVVRAYDRQGTRVATGSAVVVGREQVVTSCHVVDRAAEVTVSRGNVAYGATVEWPDAARDLCQLRVRELTAPAAPMGETAALKVGQRVFAIGAPQGRELALTDSLVSSLPESGDGKARLVHVTTEVPAGSTGGGLFDEQGRLVGILTHGFRGQQANVALPVDWLRELPARGKEALAGRKAEPEPAAAAAAADDGLPKEMPRVGDTWTYVLIDVTYRPHDRSRKFVHTVTKADRSAIIESVVHNGAQIKAEGFTPEIIGVYRQKAEMVELAPFATAFRALKPGEDWGRPRIRNLENHWVLTSTGEVPYAFTRARVVREERVRVAAGTFDAVRVDIDGRVSNVLLGNSTVMRGYTTFKQTVWYAPSVKRALKAELKTPQYTVAYELESYSLK